MNKILITSIGRTGTVSLAHYLNDIPGVICFHEKERQDVPFLFLSQVEKYSNLTEDYLIRRDKEISELNCETYIEVNPYLRFADYNILKKLGWKKVFIVREPKSYLESVYVRKLFTKNDYILNQFPDNNDPLSKNWHELTRFQKLCWYYVRVHDYILKSENSFYRFEDLVKSSSNIKQLISDLKIDDTKVTTYTLPKLNTTFKNKLKRKLISLFKGKTEKITPLNWANLSLEEKETFQNIKEKFEKELGYVL